MRKALRLTAIVVFAALVLCSALIAGDVAYAEANEADFYLDTFEVTSKERFFNAETGCTYRVILSEAAYRDLISVSYDVVKLKGTDLGEVVPGVNNVVEGYEYLSRGTVVEKSDPDAIKVFDSQSSKRYAYFEVTAHCWSAFVFTVWYDGVQGKTAAYDSKVLESRVIDDSVPEAYYTDWIYDSGDYVFTVTVRGNRRSDSLTLDSGLSAFTVKKDGVKIDEVKDINKTSYIYKLRVPPTKGLYQIDAIDRVGNESVYKIVEFDSESYDPDFESACDILSTDIELGEYADFSETLLSDFQRKYEEYFLLIQGEEKDKQDIAKVQDEIRDLMRYVAKLKKMRDSGEKEVEVLSPGATDYFGSELTVKGTAEAYPDQKYGERLQYLFSVAELSPKTPTRASARAAAKINDATTLYSIAVRTTVDGEEVRIDFAIPLVLRVNKELALVAVQTTDAGSRVLKTVVGSGYTDIYLTSGYGTVDLFVDGKKDLTYLWALTAIPVVAGAAVATILIVRKKKRKQTLSSEKKEQV